MTGIKDTLNITTIPTYGASGFFTGFDYINSNYTVSSKLSERNIVTTGTDPPFNVMDEASFILGSALYYDIKNNETSDVTNPGVNGDTDPDLKSYKFSNVFVQSTLNAGSQYNLTCTEYIRNTTTVVNNMGLSRGRGNVL